VDPDNRLVASELERRWNDKLIEARRLEDEQSSPGLVPWHIRTALAVSRF
jgi:hypothetical protein